eukprot:CAMPEP_0172504430 /NCGR_PEP_ID=MMETSP1066-20121228/178725_1 /TAXON_ID=671091 /ORGANISM="Coscinodiscus wailesii, Strain CCMP2513" /LENGTH=145 /DNA_ID=CAMNT_0013280617 /DNA_START=68 /DNA_END=505 /DNA_ORIENTATION=+
MMESSENTLPPAQNPNYITNAAIQQTSTFNHGQSNGTEHRYTDIWIYEEYDADDVWSNTENTRPQAQARRASSLKSATTAFSGIIKSTKNMATSTANRMKELEGKHDMKRKSKAAASSVRKGAASLAKSAYDGGKKIKENLKSEL